MEHLINDHEQRIRDLEKSLNKLDIRLRELAFSQSVNGNLITDLIPKLNAVIEDNKLADRVEKQLKASENAGWTRRERYMAVWVALVTTTAPLITAFLHLYK